MSISSVYSWFFEKWLMFLGYRFNCLYQGYPLAQNRVYTSCTNWLWKVQLLSLQDVICSKLPLNLMYSFSKKVESPKQLYCWLYVISIIFLQLKQILPENLWKVCITADLYFHEILCHHSSLNDDLECFLKHPLRSILKNEILSLQEIGFH